LRSRDAAQREIRRQEADARDECPTGHGIDRNALHAGTAVEGRASQHRVVTPAEPVGGAVDGHPDLAGPAESHAEHAVGEHALHAGGRDALIGRDGAGVGDLTTGSKRLRLRGNLE